MSATWNHPCASADCVPLSGLLRGGRIHAKHIVMGQICFQVNLDLTLVDSKFPLTPSPKRQRKLRISLGKGGWGWKANPGATCMQHNAWQQQQQHQKLYLHDHKGITVLQKLLV